MAHPLIDERGSPSKFDRIVTELTETVFFNLR